MILDYVDCSNYKKYKIGTKATRLFRMKELGINVPDLICVLKDKTINLSILEKFNVKKYAIRSSGNLEDNNNTSFAGQFTTYLNVAKNDVNNKIHQCFMDSNLENVRDYLKEKNISKNALNMNVIIQKQINSDVSGVCFTANPKGILNEIVIVVGRGLGNNVVEDKIDVTTYYYNKSDGKCYYEKTKDSPELDEVHLNKIVETALRLEKEFKFYQDIEFAIENSEVYFLQSRNITTLDMNKEKIVLDNSNIVESYPGISLPLTQSFAKEVYYKIFKQVLIRITSNDKSVKDYETMLQNMVTSVNGRMYYQISNFYDFLNFLPFHKKIISVWQESLGIKDKKITRNHKIGFRIHSKVVRNFFKLLKNNIKEMDGLLKFIEDFLPIAWNRVDKENSVDVLMNIYDELMKEIILKWDLTLVNDMYAFLYVKFVKNKNLISKINNLESLKPALLIKNIKTEADKKKYINLYGDRILEELKLETKTYRTNPELLDQHIEHYKDIEVNNPKNDINIKNAIERRAIAGIKYREASRLYRARIYGVARALFLKIGTEFCKMGYVRNQRDIFYLTIDEIRNAKNYIDLIDSRREEYENYKDLKCFSRLEFLGEIININPRTKNSNNRYSKTLYGIGTSEGIAEGEILIIEANTNVDTVGKIIVTKTTDPGWIFLISKANGIIAEKGSILSHTAIISRELGKPAIVGVDDATEILKNGQRVRIDAKRGIIECLN